MSVTVWEKGPKCLRRPSPFARTTICIPSTYSPSGLCKNRTVIASTVFRALFSSRLKLKTPSEKRKGEKYKTRTEGLPVLPSSADHFDTVYSCDPDTTEKTFFPGFISSSGIWHLTPFPLNHYSSVSASV